jgi:flagellar protein FliO/FliZ
LDTLVLAARVALSLAVVLGVLWFLQRRVSRSTRVKRAASAVTVVTRQGIAPKASVVVVDIEGSRYLLGVTEQSVTLLSSGEAPVPPAVLAAVPVPAPVAVPAAVSVAPLAGPTVAGGSPSAGAFAQSLEAEGGFPVAPAADPESAYRRPRDRASRRSPIAQPASPAAGSPLAGSILSGATWRQAAAALRQRRAG